jgi:hypothetical protein
MNHIFLRPLALDAALPCSEQGPLVLLGAVIHVIGRFYFIRLDGNEMFLCGTNRFNPANSPQIPNNASQKLQKDLLSSPVKPTTQFVTSGQA